jgi:heat shock protein HtpX
MNFFSYFFSDKIVLFIYRAKEIKENDNKELFSIVREVSRAGSIPMPRVYIVPSEQLNAFATGRSPKHAAVACTQGILKALNKDELKGVLAHEISHIKNRDTLIQTIAATIAGIIGFIASMARWGAIFGGFGGDRDNNWIELLVLAIVAPIAAVLLQLAISRSREYFADASAAQTLKNSKGLASALEKISGSVKHTPLGMGNPTTSSLFIANPFHASGILSLFSTHPPIDQRIQRLKNMRF